MSTKADDANTRGKSIGKMAACAASPLGAPRPTVATTHEKAKANNRTRPRAPTYAGTPPWMRNPTAMPTPVMRTRTETLRTPSAIVRPASTAERAMGSDRNRSMSPLFRSSARPMPVPADPNSAVCTMMPAIR